MKPVRCIIGIHSGNIKPAYAIPKEVDALSAFECSRCGKIDPMPKPKGNKKNTIG